MGRGKFSHNTHSAILSPQRNGVHRPGQSAIPLPSSLAFSTPNPLPAAFLHPFIFTRNSLTVIGNLTDYPASLIVESLGFPHPFLHRFTRP